jgi:predicted aldo/keto reductase-like oxidoreductase
MHEGDRSGLVRRRELLQRGAAAALGASALPLATWAREEASAQRYVELGGTGLRISDISFGSSRTTDPELVRYALARGVTYFDTAERYKGGRAEEAIGAALAGERERVVLASKVRAGARTPRDELMRSLEGSLRRLRTDRIDVYFNHAVNDLDRLQNPEWLEFAERAKREGKIRFTGMSGHGGRLIECLDYALDHDLFDVLLVAYNFGQDPSFYERFTRSFDFVAVQPDLPRVLEKAAARRVGVIAMKTLMGARLNDMRPWERGGTFAQAAFRWVLSSPHVDALVISMTSRERIDEFLAASGAAGVRESDRRLLERYVRRNGASYCRHGCAECTGSCPYGVPISEVLRTRMYATDYGDLELARADYSKLGPGAAACAGCARAPCLGACPHGLAIAPLTRSAHRMLELSMPREVDHDRS